MATTESPVNIGVFRDRTLAEQAVEELRHVGFQDDEIRVWGKGASSGGFLDSLFSKLSGQGTGDGSVASSLVAMGVPQEEADYYQHEGEAGHSIVAVRSFSHQQEADNILYRFGAYNARTGQMHDMQTVPLREEVLQAQKQPVEVGAVFIRKEIITEEKTITVTVQREEVFIERRPLSAQDTSPNANNAGGTLVELPPGQTIRIPIREEQVFIEKRPIVTGELIVSKRGVQETRQFSDTVRREVPHLERTGDVIVHDNDSVDGV